MIYEGKVQDGVVILESGVKLPNGIAVRVEPLDADTSSEKEPLPDDSIFHMSELAVDTGIPDLSTNIDHHLYGHPKVENGG